MPIRDIPRDLQLEDEKGIINRVNEYNYLGVKIVMTMTRFRQLITQFPLVVCTLVNI